MLQKLKVRILRVAGRLVIGPNSALVRETASGVARDLSLNGLELSTRIVTTTSTALSLTIDEHAERLVLINSNSAGASTFTLPAATGSGAKMTLINNLVQTQGTVVFAADGTDVLKGICMALDSTAAADAMSFLTTATSDKATLNLTTSGGLGQDMFEAWDVAANVWQVRMVYNGSGTLVTPFAAT